MSLLGKVAMVFGRIPNVFSFPQGDAIIGKMNPVETAPPARMKEDSRSTLLVAGVLDGEGALTIHRDLLYYRVNDGAWISDSDGGLVDTKFTHWIYAEDQEKVFG